MPRLISTLVFLCFRLTWMDHFFFQTITYWSTRDWRLGGPHFQVQPKTNFSIMIKLPVKSTGGRAASDSTLKQLNTCGVSNTCTSLYIAHIIERKPYQIITMALTQTSATPTILLFIMDWKTKATKTERRFQNWISPFSDICTGTTAVVLARNHRHASTGHTTMLTYDELAVTSHAYHLDAGRAVSRVARLEARMAASIRTWPAAGFFAFLTIRTSLERNINHMNNCISRWTQDIMVTMPKLDPRYYAQVGTQCGMVTEPKLGPRWHEAW